MREKRPELKQQGPRTIDDFAEEGVKRSVLNARERTRGLESSIDEKATRDAALKRTEPRRKLAKQILSEVREANRKLEHPSRMHDYDMVELAWHQAGLQLALTPED